MFGLIRAGLARFRSGFIHEKGVRGRKLCDGQSEGPPCLALRRKSTAVIRVGEGGGQIKRRVECVTTNGRAL